MTEAHEAHDWTGEFTVEYSGPNNLVIRCPECESEQGHRVIEPYTVAPHEAHFAHCVECRKWLYHYPVREAERGEFDGDYICDECDTMYTNTMDADMCCGDGEGAREEFEVDV